MLIFLLAFLHVSDVSANCDDINIGQHKLTIEKNGDVTVDGLQLATSQEKGVETGYVESQVLIPQGYKPREEVKDVINRVALMIRRDDNKMPSAVTINPMLWDKKKGVELNPYGKPGMGGFNLIRYEFTNDAKSGCNLKRIIAGNQFIHYDRGLCERLSKSLAKFDSKEVAQCDSILKEMSSAIESFKSEMAKEGKVWKVPEMGKNPYDAVLVDAADCRNMIAPKMAQAKTLRIKEEAETSK